MARIISFKGKIADSIQETIPLQTNDGKTGYRIIKFQLLGLSENLEYETAVKIYKTDQDGTFTETVDFSDNRLLAAGLYGDATGTTARPSQIVIFDNEVFNQDIFIYAKAASGSNAINYYIELEQMKLDMNQQTVATLKDIRNSNTQS